MTFGKRQNDKMKVRHIEIKNRHIEVKKKDKLQYNALYHKTIAIDKQTLYHKMIAKLKRGKFKYTVWQER